MPPPPATTWIRFVILKKDRDSHQPMGIFQAAYELQESGRLDAHELAWLGADLAWLRMHLKSPAGLQDPGTERCLSWFHPRAKKPIARVRSLAALLEEHGFHVRTLTTRRPGKILYEDGWQVVAWPFRQGT